MILLDTNVISELMKPKPTVRVVDWVSEQNPGSLFISTITQAEILYGIALLSSWKRKSSLTKSALIMFKEDFEGRILSFDIEASIAKSRGLKIATRNTRDFENCGIVLINPWD